MMEETAMNRSSSPVKRKPRLVSKEQTTVGTIGEEDRARMIAEAAYYKAERRGFVGGDPLQDWLDAEAEIDRILDHKKSA
jgi:hypothetical protein